MYGHLPPKFCFSSMKCALFELDSTNASSLSKRAHRSLSSRDEQLCAHLKMICQMFRPIGSKNESCAFRSSACARQARIVALW
jgi:hypothetical protein